jgi:hypothetical protein
VTCADGSAGGSGAVLAGASMLGGPGAGLAATGAALAAGPAVATEAVGGWDVTTGRYAGAVAHPVSPATETRPKGSSRRNGLARSMSAHLPLAIRSARSSFAEEALRKRNPLHRTTSAACDEWAYSPVAE